jgi:hypothetical protein
VLLEAMTDSYFEKVLRSARTFLTRWNGADGELLELTRSHKSLRILLRRQSGEGNLLIACVDPRSIEGPVRWTNSGIEIRIHQFPLENDRGFCLVDIGSGLEVVCGSVELKENVKFD